MFIDVRERKEAGEKETSMWDRNIDWLPPVSVLTGIKPAT